METMPGMFNGGMGNPPMPSSPPVIPLNLRARTYMSWPNARCSMANAVPLTRTIIGHKIRARATAARKPKRSATSSGHPSICSKARAVP